MPSNINEKIEALFSQFRLRTYSKGQILIMNGDEVKDIYYLIEGKVKQCDTTYRGDEIILNVYQPNAFFPMSLIINKAPSPYTFLAETDIKVHQAPADKALIFIKENPDVLYDLLARVYRGTDGLLNRITFLMSGSAKSRILFELYTESKRFGKLQTDGSIELTISETELAARAGLSRETVSREFHKLKDEEIISSSTTRILVNDIDAIQKKLKLEN